MFARRLTCCWLLAPALAACAWAADQPRAAEQAAVVSHITVVSDKVPDISSLEAWSRSFLKPGMSDEEKALAIWRTTVMFQHQDSPPAEFLNQEGLVYDPLKIFHVYGYSFCSVASADVAALARHAGLPARGWAINKHSVPEVYCSGHWRLLDGSLINYFPRPDGTLAGVEEIISAVSKWNEDHPGLAGNDAKLREFQRGAGGAGWKQGPPLLAASPWLDDKGWWPAKSHGWYSTMQEYDGKHDSGRKAYLTEYGYSQGYQLNIQLRPGERLTRNWSNRGLHINADRGGGPSCINSKTGSGALVYTTRFGDLAPGRVGNGTLEYDIPVQSATYRAGALVADNLDEQAVRVKDAGQPGVLILRMPSSYVYLKGSLTITPILPPGGSIAVSFSDNNGLDWRPLAKIDAAGEQRIDLSPHVLRRYEYRLRFVLSGGGTGLSSLRLTHDIQHSQRPLPALDVGDNKITFAAGPAEGTVTIEGSTNLANKNRQLVYSDFHPEVRGFEQNLFIDSSGEGEITFPVATEGDLVRLRFGSFYRARDARDGLDYQVSFDNGRTWQTVARAAGPTAGDCKYVTLSQVPAGTRKALVRYAGTSHNATGLLSFRIDADYVQPHGGFRPVKVTYAWEENGQARQDVHIAKQPQETYVITCAARPTMKSIVLELAN